MDTARRYYPRSFLRLLLLSFGAVALPFALAFFAAALQVEELAETSGSAMSEAVQAAHASRALVEELPMLERVARQYLVLGDKALLGDYEKLRGRFAGIVQELSRLPLEPAQRREIDEIGERELELFNLLQRTGRSSSDRRALVNGYEELTDRTRAALYASHSVLAGAVEGVRASAQGVRHNLWWRFAAVLALGVLVCLAVTLLIARPIQRLDQAIRRLGTGELEQRVEVQGPADLSYLGTRLEWLRARLAELEQQKRLFLRHVSHELKSPLASLREGTDLLVKGTAGPLAPVQKDIVDILRQKTGQLQDMIEELLNYHRAQEDVMRKAGALVQMDEVVHRVLEEHRLPALARGIRAETRIEPATVQGDPKALHAVVDNLVTNAIKYSPEGGTITLAMHSDGRSVRLDVGDHGPGVAREDHERIFEWFYRARPAGARGSGLGLAIAKEFVEAHGGSIRVVDDGAPGARFRVTLPLAGTEGSS